MNIKELKEIQALSLARSLGFKLRGVKPFDIEEHFESIVFENKIHCQGNVLVNVRLTSFVVSGDTTNASHELVEALDESFGEHNATGIKLLTEYRGSITEKAQYLLDILCTGNDCGQGVDCKARDFRRRKEG